MKRNIERRLEELEEEVPDNDDMLVVWKDPDTGDWYDAPLGRDGDRIERVDVDADPMIVITERVVESDWSPNQ